MVSIYRLFHFLMLPKDPTHRGRIGFYDCIMIFIISMISYLFRFWVFQRPDRIVFDECYFGNFTNNYIRGEYFFDIHPPLAKLLITGLSVLAQYNATTNYTKIPTMMYNDIHYLTLRVIVICFSSFTGPFAYIIMRISNFTISSSFIASLFIMCDNLLLIEGKYILTDGILHAFTLLYIIILTISYDHFPEKKYLIFTGLGLFLPISVKYTSMSLIPITGFYILVNYLQRAKLSFNTIKLAVIYTLVITFIAYSLLIVIWYYHLYLLPYKGEQMFSMGRDASVTCLEDSNDDFMKRYKRPFAIERLIYLLGYIRYANSNNFEPHFCMSRPQHWPLLQDIGVYYTLDANTHIFLIGNRFVFYFVLVGVILCSIAIWSDRWITAIKYVMGWCVSYFPFFMVPRTMFVYHYCIPLLFGCLCFGSCLDIYIRNKYWRNWVSVICIFLVMIQFIANMPTTYDTEKNELHYLLWDEVWTKGRDDSKEYHLEMKRKYDAFMGNDETPKATTGSFSEWKSPKRI